MRPLPEPRRGQVWSVDFGPVRGHEQGGVRPVLIISNDQFNSTPHTLCIVVPLTRTYRRLPSHLPIEPPAGGLTSRSFLLCEQAKSISVTRLRRLMGAVELATVHRAQRLVGRSIDR